jgi:hypothetical protein
MKSEEERWGVTTLTPHLTPFSRRYGRRRGAAKAIRYGCAKGISKDNFFSMIMLVVIRKLLTMDEWHYECRREGFLLT